MMAKIYTCSNCKGYGVLGDVTKMRDVRAFKRTAEKCKVCEGSGYVELKMVPAARPDKSYFEVDDDPT